MVQKRWLFFACKILSWKISLSAYSIFNADIFLCTEILQKIKNANFGIKGGMNWNFGYDQQQSDMNTIIT